VIITTLSMTLICCPLNLGSSGPAAAAQRWLEAVADREGTAVLKLTCQAQQESVQNAGFWTAALGLLLQTEGVDPQEATIDPSELTFETVVQEEDRASVQVSGTMYVGYREAALSYAVDETWTMVQEEGQWKWCGGHQNTPAASPSSDAPRWTLVPLREHRTSVIGQRGVWTGVDEGWTYAVVEVGIKNVSGEWAPVKEADPLLDGLQLQTAEGYTYDVLHRGRFVEPEGGYERIPCAASFYVTLPPDFTIWHSVAFQVAESSTGHQLVLPDGTALDLEDVDAPALPTERSPDAFPRLEGTPIQIGEEARLTFEAPSAPTSNLQVENLQGGYETTVYPGAYIIDATGLTIKSGEPCPGDFSMPRLEVGPGQTENFTVQWPAFSRPAYLVMESEQLVYTIP
jgi:hypothetical protein